jgi:hypothetical protein
MKTYRGVEKESHALLASATDGCELLASRSDRFTPRERDQSRFEYGVEEKNS